MKTGKRGENEDNKTEKSAKKRKKKIWWKNKEITKIKGVKQIKK